MQLWYNYSIKGRRKNKMKLDLSTSQAADILYKDDNANWTYSGARALVEYLEEIDPDMELDIVALRCDFSQYDSLQAFNKDYFGGKSDLETDEEILEYINDHGTIIEFDGGIIVSDF